MKEKQNKKTKTNLKIKKLACTKIPPDSLTNTHLHDKKDKSPKKIRRRMIIIKQMSKPPGADVSSLNDGLRAEGV